MNCIIVSPHFPPATVAGVHRARHMMKWLPKFGWEPTLVSVDPKFYISRLDPELARLIPDDIDQVKVTAIPEKISRPFGVGDIGIRAYMQLGAAIERAAVEKRADVVFMTGSPFYPLLLSGRIKRNTGLPIILDFQDPWVTKQGSDRPLFSKGRVAHFLSHALEPMAVKHASFITSVSTIQNQQLADRYQYLHSSNMAAIPIGGDPEDFIALKKLGHTADRPSLLKPHKINFSYVGTLLPRAERVVRILFRALVEVKKTNPTLFDKIHFNFIGTSNQTAQGAAKLVMPLALEEGIEGSVSEYPARVPYLHALSTLVSSDAIMFIGSDEPHYTASKIYPGLMSGTPFISLFHEQSSAHHLLSTASGGLAFSFSSLEGPGTIVSDLASGLIEIAEGGKCLGEVDPKIYQDFTAESVAGSFAEVFSRVVNNIQ